MKSLILMSNGFISIPENESSKKTISDEQLATICSNIVYYGYTLSKNALKTLKNLEAKKVDDWWRETEKTLKEITGAHKNVDKYVVYKNFPQEVLEMSYCEYWIKQILMYIGLPNEIFTEEEKERKSLFEGKKLKVLQLADEKTLTTIFSSLLSASVRWTKDQSKAVLYLIEEDLKFNVKNIPFKENFVLVAKTLIDKNIKIKISSAMDILRLAIGLSEGDITLKTNTKFRSFSVKERKYLLTQLENSSNLEADLARDENRWKKFLYGLHPNDFKKEFLIVCKLNDKLYHGQVSSISGKIHSLIAKEDKKALELLSEFPGEFVRRLQKTIDVFGQKAVDSFIGILDKLTVIQLLKIQKYLKTISYRKFRTFAPKGNWTKLQVHNNNISIKLSYVLEISKAIDKRLKNVLNEKLSTGVNLDDDTDFVRLQTNDNELCPYGRGTTFFIPKNINFIRTASYWATPEQYGNVWYDNGWNFFDEQWSPVGTVCWSSVNLGSASVFSGDPTSSKTKDGKACQMIDLYIDKLIEYGARYAVWNILCYNKKSFDEAQEVFASLQWGEKPQEGKLFEPSRSQLSFQLKGKNLTKYIAYIDLVERKLIYVDANLYGVVNSAVSNEKILQEKFPAFLEYLNTLPTVYDLFKNVKKNKNGLVITYSDKNKNIKKGKAYVFRQENQDNKFQQLNISELLL